MSTSKFIILLAVVQSTLFLVSNLFHSNIIVYLNSSINYNQDTPSRVLF